jgi:anti-sigma factor RsiW
MAKNDPTFPDADLVAFVDHRLPEAHRQRIAEMAAKDKQLAARIALLTDGTPSLQATFQADLAKVPVNVQSKLLTLVNKPPSHTAEIIPITSPKSFGADVSRRRWFAGVSAVAASFVAGVTAAKLLPERILSTGQMPGNDWREAVAQYHALYGKATIERLNPTSDEKANELVLVSQALGYPLQNVALAASGYTYKRAQLLEFDGAPLVQIVFEAPGQVPVAFCLKRQRSQKPASLTVENRLGMALASWSRNGIDQLVVARLSAETIQSLATKLERQG